MDKNNKGISPKYSAEEIASCVALLEDFSENIELLLELSEEQRISLMQAAGRLSRPNREETKKRKKLFRKSRREERTQKDRQSRANTGIRSARTSSVFTAPAQIPLWQEGRKPEEQELKSPRNCYVCKSEYTRLHFFYDAMCTACGDFNYQKRFQTTSLEGQVALITGARLKIGYQAALLMLRAGAKVIVTTRFPVDAATRFSQEADFGEWGDRLHVYGLDLRHTPSVEIFCSYIEQQYDRLDILLNNAAQTVRRPPGFYTHLLENEKKAFLELPQQVQSILGSHQACKKQLSSLPSVNVNESVLPAVWHGTGPGVGILASAELSQIPYSYGDSLATEEIFPVGKLDADLQQVDLRKTNSWRLKMGEISTPEMLEVQLVNAVAPFVLNNRLVALMKRANTGQKHIVNVSAMEGKFFRFKKDSRHPHTNMAKAALNMLTHTSSQDLAKEGIFMNAVDTGWVTDEDPVELAERKEKEHDFQPPLDIVDGAARICDPFFDGILTGKHWSGKFLKDYFPIDW